MAKYGFISLDDPVLPTVAVMGDNPANATQNSDAWDAAVYYAVQNGLLGVWVPKGILPVNRVPTMDGAKCLSIDGWGRLRSMFKKYGSAVSPVSENDPNRAKNTRIGHNITFPNAVLHVFNQWSDGYIRNVGFLTDVIDTSNPNFPPLPGMTAMDASTDQGVVIHGMSRGEVEDIFIAGTKQVGYVDLYPSITSTLKKIRISYTGNGAALWSHNQPDAIVGIYSSHYRYIGISASLDGGGMVACPVEMGGSPLTGHQPGDLVVAYALRDCRSAFALGCIGEGNMGCVLELANNDSLHILMREFIHRSDYVPGQAPRIYSAYGSGNNHLTLDLKVDYAPPIDINGVSTPQALLGGAQIADHYDFGGSGNTNSHIVRNDYGSAWGNKSSGAL